MKKLLAILLASLMLLTACGPVVDDTSSPATDAPTETNEPLQTDEQSQPTDPTDTGASTPAETVDTAPTETLPPEPVERFDHTIGVLADTYVLNKNGGESFLDTNFGSETEIHVKSNKGSLTRYGYLKFDISSLKGDTDFTCIELELTLSVREARSEAPTAVVAIYATDINWSEDTITFNNQPDLFNKIAENDTITSEKGSSYTFAITDYVRKALANGQSEIALYIIDVTPQVPLHIRWVTKEGNPEKAPKLSVYYGTKTDDTKYEGQTMSKGIEMSQKGLDTIIGWNTVENYKIPVIEDTYVEGAPASADKNFGSSDVIENKAIAGSGSMSTYRISLFKFDISELDDSNFSLVQLAFNVFDMEQSSKERVINVYSCDPYAWEENKVTFNTLCPKEDLIASVGLVGTGLKIIDITDYVKEAKKYGDKQIAFWLEGESTSMYRTRIDSKEKVGGVAPYLNVVSGDSTFTTKIEYKGENPWDVAMDAVTTWFDRWEVIKANGRNDAELIVKDAEEYSITVDANTSSNANGANTVYKQYPTRNVSTLKGYKASTAETKLYDEYGGYTGGEKYEATGYFYTKKIGDRWWNIDPLGYPFYRTSVVATAYGSSPRQKEVTLAKYGTKEAWAEAITDRLFELGFNSVGGWSEIATLSKVDNPLSQTQIFNVATQYGTSIGVKVSAGGTRLPEADVIPSFDPGFATFADDRIKGLVSAYANDPSVYGWMSDNELADNLNMLDHALNLDYTDYRRAYTYATAWTFMYLKTGKENVSLLDVTNELRHEYLAMTYDKYFEVVTTALKKYDPNHMYMGCRFVNNNYKREYIMRVAGYWCDVVTFNYYNAWEGDPVLLQNIGNWLGNTPFVVTEWYTKGMDVTEKDPLMVNKTGAGWVVRNQTERGKFYQNYALMLMECKHCVGFDWFKFWDNDPLDASADSSNIDSNKGVFSNDGNEYTDLTKYMKELNTQKYNIIKFFDAR